MDDLFSPLHLLIVLGIALLVFGPRRLPELGAGLGKSIREFREATSGVSDAFSPVQQALRSPAQALLAPDPRGMTAATASAAVLAADQAVAPSPVGALDAQAPAADAGPIAP